MSEALAILATVGSLLGGVGAIGSLVFSVRRGSDRENRRAAAVAVEVAKDPTVTPIEPKRDGESA